MILWYQNHKIYYHETRLETSHLHNGLTYQIRRFYAFYKAVAKQTSIV